MAQSGPGGNKAALTRRLLLSDQGQKYVESTFARYAPESPPSSAPITVLFDTKQLLLFRQDVQLLRIGDGASSTWELRVPTSLSASSGLLGAEPPKDVTVSDAHTVLGDQAAIAGRLGMAPGQSLDEALREQGLRPLARWRCGRASFSAEADTAETPVSVELETFHFDTKHAEPAAIAARLAAEHSESRPPLGAVFAELRVMASGPEDVLDRFVRKHRLDVPSGGARPRSTVVAEYLRLCRPAHFWELSQEVGMTLEAGEAPRSLLGVAALAGEPESDEDDTVYRI